MRKLRYLSVSYPKSRFDERCVSRMNVSLARMNLFASGIFCDHNVPLQIEILLPAFRMLQHFSGVGSTGAQGAGAPPYLKLPYLLASMKFRTASY